VCTPAWLQPLCLRTPTLPSCQDKAVKQWPIVKRGCERGWRETPAWQTAELPHSPTRQRRQGRGVRTKATHVGFTKTHSHTPAHNTTGQPRQGLAQSSTKCCPNAARVRRQYRSPQPTPRNGGKRVHLTSQPCPARDVTGNSYKVLKLTSGTVEVGTLSAPPPSSTQLAGTVPRARTTTTFTAPRRLLSRRTAPIAVTPSQTCEQSSSRAQNRERQSAWHTGRSQKRNKAAVDTGHSDQPTERTWHPRTCPFLHPLRAPINCECPVAHLCNQHHLCET
jgi:hypothetical protein